MSSHTFTRRRFVLGAGGLLAAATAPRLLNPALSRGAPLPSQPLFTLGVASGDPTPDGVVLWTRLAPDPLGGGGMPDRPVLVQWELARDEDMRQVVRRGLTLALAQLAHSVHVEVGGLDAGGEYWYRFTAGGQQSPVGRTLTAPSPGDTRPLSFAFASCQDWQNGYYTAYRRLAEEELDLVVHLGDYIYEYGPGAKLRPASPPARVHDGPEAVDLAGYRNRHALYKTDPALQAAHALCPWIVTWDDHEVENNHAGGQREESAVPPGDFGARRAAAYRAYYEHQPVRLTSFPLGSYARLFRRVEWGALATFHVLDTRQFRTDQPCGGLFGNCLGRLDPWATMTGPLQELWLLDGLTRSEARWNVLAQQTIFAEVDFNPWPGSFGLAGLFNVDQWDGYVAQRRRITQFLADRGPSNPIVLSGDIHSSWANEVKVDYGDPGGTPVAAEFVGTSISSDFPALLAPVVAAALPDNPHVRFFDGIHRGYVRCAVGPDEWRTDYRGVATIDVPDSTVSTVASFALESGSSALHPA
jgi:alkaline phosphatase D